MACFGDSQGGPYSIWIETGQVDGEGGIEGRKGKGAGGEERGETKTVVGMKNKEKISYLRLFFWSNDFCILKLWWNHWSVSEKKRKMWGKLLPIH